MIQINRHPSRKQLRLFAALTFPGFFAVVALILVLRFDRPEIALPIAIVTVAISIAGLASPPFMRIVYLGMIYATYPIGFVMSHVLLALVYYLVLTPIGLLMRLVGRDPMNRDLDPGLATYWIRKERPADPDRYFRQY